LDTKSKQQADAQSATSVREQALPPLPPGENRDILLGYYHQMVLIRHFEEKSAEMYTKAKIGGYCHLNLGEEATVVGYCVG
jgi:pyruvate dehydrogenase E1 component alpha subunit